MEKLVKNDFIEIEYSARVKDSKDIFDSSEKQNKDNRLIICLGQNFLLPAVEEFLVGKGLGEYKIDLKPEGAFGLRTRELIKTMPLGVFDRHEIKPQLGMIFTFDNLLGKITAISGGRVIVDFNHPLAGKEVTYEIKVVRKVTEENEKVKALMSIFFRKEFIFKIENSKLIINVEKDYKKLVELFGKKFKDILNLDIEVIEKEEAEQANAKEIS